jgi:hypothetical protein
MYDVPCIVLLAHELHVSCHSALLLESFLCLTSLPVVVLEQGMMSCLLCNRISACTFHALDPLEKKAKQTLV